MQIMERGNVYADNVERGGCSDDNGFDRRRVDVVVNVDKMPTCDVTMFQLLLLLLLLKATPRCNTSTNGI